MATTGNEKKEKRKNLFLSILCCAMMLFCLLPCIMYTMAMMRITLYVFLLALCVWYIVFLLKIDLRNVGRGLKYFAVCCVVLMILAQVLEQLRHVGEPFVLWRYAFYYDKPYAAGMIWTMFTLFPMLIRLFYVGKKDTEEWHEKFRLFFKDSVTSFLIIYTAMLVFGLILNRSVSETAEFNFTPFKTVIEYINSPPKYVYENAFMLFGNIGLFVPLGFFVTVKFAGKHKLWLIIMPFLVSGGIELSQFIFKNGHVDIDDLILNVLGFYIGVLVKILLDFIRLKITKGKEKTIFI